MRYPPQNQQRGFALVIALSLMSFVVLLLLTMSSLVRVETASSSIGLAKTEAQQNALLAMNVALGQMQKYTGPDQRITATADLENGPSVANPRWVGVYGNSVAADYNQSPGAITPNAPVLLNWMVSGNENQSFTASTGGADFGRITNAPDPSAIENTPDEGTDLTGATPSTELSIGGSDAVLLVGPNSVESSKADIDYVAAPLVDIEGVQSTGRYAWWVGDEGAKAKVNLRPSFLDQPDLGDRTAFQRYSFITAQRTGIELVDSDDASLIGTAYDYTDDQVGAVQSLSLLPFLGNDASQVSELESAISHRFHDLTAYSYSILSDSFAGGLKKDLTADIAGAPGRPADDEPLFETLNSSDIVPTWGQIRGFALQNGTTTDPILPSETSPGLFPVISYAALGMDFFIGPYAGSPGATDEFIVAFYPIVVLWNPHNVTLNASAYELGFHLHNASESSTDSSFAIEWREDGGSFSTIDELDLYRGQWRSSGSSGSNFMRFRVETDEIQPGAAQIFTLPNDDSAPYEAGLNTLRPADAGLVSINHYVTWTSEAIRTEVTSAIIDNGIDDAGEVRVRGFNPRDRGQSFTVVLARPDGISNLTDRSEWYQAVLDARPGRLGPVSAGRTTLLPPTPVAFLPRFNSPAASNVYRIQAVMEGRGGNSAFDLVGPLRLGRARWLATGNPRAPIVRNTSVENLGSNRGNVIYGANFQLYDFDRRFDRLVPFLGRTNGNLVGIGREHNTSAARYAPAVLFDHLATPEDLLSLGQLQHAIVGPFGFYPTYIFGNSAADVRIPRDEHFVTGLFSEDFSDALSQPLYDLSWHVNRSLWDRYFISGVPADWAAGDVSAKRPLPNSRITYYEEPDISDIDQTEGGSDAYTTAAANLWVNGGFNVNSTSVQAWRALLTAAQNLPQNTDYADSGDDIANIAAIPRFSRNLSYDSFNNTMQAFSGSASQSQLGYFGNRGLLMPVNGRNLRPIETVVDSLAQNIVDEVRNRGPFLSLADFVNRSLTLDDAGIKGALQTAIDTMTLPAQVNSDLWTNTGAAVQERDKPISAWDSEHYFGGPSSDGYSTRFAYAPKYLTQADLLSFLGPSLSARSDTFKIRSYGETVNPNGEVEGRAWLEAVIQRIPEYVDPRDEAITEPRNLSSAINQRFGRRYEVVSIRWLDASEI